MVCFAEFWNEAPILAFWREAIDPKDSAFFFFFVNGRAVVFFFFPWSLYGVILRMHKACLHKTGAGVFFSSKIFSQRSLSLPENIARSRSIKWATDAKPGEKKKKRKQTIFSAHLWSEDNTGPEAHIVKQFQS